MKRKKGRGEEERKSCGLVVEDQEMRVELFRTSFSPLALSRAAFSSTRRAAPTHGPCGEPTNCLRVQSGINQSRWVSLYTSKTPSLWLS